jgi:hypothetical protein
MLLPYGLIQILCLTSLSQMSGAQCLSFVFCLRKWNPINIVESDDISCDINVANGCTFLSETPNSRFFY